MNVALWCAQILLAVVFTTSGVMKSLLPKENLVARGQTGVRFFPTWAIRLIAAGELLGVLGLILPRLTGTGVILTAFAAAGLAIVMIGAMVTHIKLREPRNIVITAAILVVCVFVAVGRFAGQPDRGIPCRVLAMCAAPFGAFLGGWPATTYDIRTPFYAAAGLLLAMTAVTPP